MGKLEIYIPAMGEGIIEATITRWFKKEGESVVQDESIVEIATDKVDSEITAPVNGIIEKILYNEGVAVKVGEVIAIINSSEINNDNENPDIIIEDLKVDKEKLLELEKKSNENIKTKSITTENNKFLSPLVRSIIIKENIPDEEIEKISGTGLDGRITKDDILNYLQNRSNTEIIREVNKETKQEIISEKIPEEKPVNIPEPVANVNLKKISDVNIVEMDRLRRLTAEHTLKSKQISAHVTSFIEADVTNIVNWREKIKSDFLKKTNEKLTFTPVFIEATVKALKDYPMINISVEGFNILVKNYINIGLATNLPSGNLIVPVIKNADNKNLVELTKSVNDLAKRARENRLVPDEIRGGTFTITNLGTFGILAGTPIINQPEVAILGIGAINKKPVVIETTAGDSIAIRSIVMLSLSFDHRVIDGYLGGVFLKKIAEYLEKFDINRTMI